MSVTTMQPYPLSSSRLADIANFISTLANTASEQIIRFRAPNTGTFQTGLPGVSSAGTAPGQGAPASAAEAGNAQPMPGGSALMQASNWLLVAGVGLLIIAGVVWLAKK